ncbi:O-antigen ligase family protein [Mycobacterium sp. 2YAF39]|uniref:O-antigen ligase family protein n=1 Tax=Mycobacterium sp. 2YAF39 TaxID=3233033 RepID=UPI003F9557FE
MIVAVTVVVFLVFLNAMRKVLQRGEWSRTATLAAVIAACTQISVDVVVTYLGAWIKTEGVSADEAPWVLPPQWHQAWRGLSLLLGLIAAAVFYMRSRRGGVPVDVPAALLAVVVLVSFLSSLLHGENPFRPVSLVYLALMIACTVAPRGLGIHVGIGAFCVFVALASGFTFLPFVPDRDFGVLPCSADKCGILGFVYGGIHGNENAFAMLLTLGMPFVYIAFRSWEGLPLCAYLLAMILMTGSRSSSIAAVITFVALMALRPDIRRPTAAPIRTRLMYLGLAVLFVVGMIVPFTQLDPTAFTGRGYLWSLARQALTDPGTLWYGTGVYAMESLRDSGLLAINAYSVHNQWLQVMFSTGLIGFALFLAALALLLWNARGAYSLVVGSVLVPVFVLSVSERPWLIDSTDWGVWAVPAVLLCFPAIHGRRKAAGTRSDPVTEERALQ